MQQTANMQKTMLRISGLLFFVLSALNYMRFVGEIPVHIGSFDVSLNMSLAMGAIFFLMAWLTLRAARQ